MEPQTQFIAGARRLGVQLSAGQLDAFARYAAALTSWNHRVRLVGSTDPHELYVRHFLDSLTLLPLLPPGLLTVVDVGTGAGLPGIPLKLARPELDLALVESVGKKAAFLRQMAVELGAHGVAVLQARAEAVGRDPAQREHYDVAVSRALAELAVVLELGLPLVRVGGLCIVLKKGDISGGLARAQNALEQLGGRLAQVRDAGLPDLLPGHLLVIIEKVAPTPERYPRRPGIPAKRPLSQVK
ncbi:MAG: 16S rRNA (guanine(527)-N(7))-methyltransferase RsmG [Dehalococcoidia bacterium]|nr:16S rRNA (guanine(527)-N(7))-methyltransferase RsmG [Dehalococcoidia bacterium]